MINLITDQSLEQETIFNNIDANFELSKFKK